MKTEAIRIRKMEFGHGIPKICVPIVGRSKEEILKQVREAVSAQPDCIEFRVDWIWGNCSESELLELIGDIRELIGDIALLFTFRTADEGGESKIETGEYIRLYESICKSGFVDMIDVETFKEEGLLGKMCEMAHKADVKVVASNHDFDKTPAEEEIVRRLQFMDKAGADVPKIAVMPKKERDVLVLQSATLKYYELGGVKPIITMSMSDFGMVSRLTGELYGSAMTFAALGKASAPGQIPIDEVKLVLNILHK